MAEIGDELTFENIIPTLISLIVNVPLTLLTTFGFNEWLKNKRVQKDLLIENLKDLLKMIQAENEQIITLGAISLSVENFRKEAAQDALVANLTRKSEILNSLISSHAKINTQFDLIVIQLSVTVRRRRLRQVDTRLKILKDMYSAGWQKYIDTAGAITAGPEFVSAYVVLSPHVRAIFTEITQILEIVNRA